MKKREVTEDMKQRALDYVFKKVRGGMGWDAFWESQKEVIEMLEAALNPPAEPEIAVSEGMANAGQAAVYNHVKYYIQADHLQFTGDSITAANEIYRAMEAARRKEAQPSVSLNVDAPFKLHRRSADGSYAIATAHRRSGDPK